MGRAINGGPKPLRWLTKVSLPIDSVPTPYSVHLLVFSLFKDVRNGDRSTSSGILYADNGINLGKRELMLLSNRYPEPKTLPNDAVLETSAVTESFFERGEYGFELVFSPFRRRGRTYIYAESLGEAASWLLAKAGGWGFEVKPGSLAVNNLGMEVVYRTAKKLPVVFWRAHAKGVLRVVDRELFIKTACTGAGRVKSYGCGLLQLSPAA